MVVTASPTVIKQAAPSSRSACLLSVPTPVRRQGVARRGAASESLHRQLGKVSPAVSPVGSFTVNAGGASPVQPLVPPLPSRSPCPSPVATARSTDAPNGAGVVMQPISRHNSFSVLPGSAGSPGSSALCVAPTGDAGCALMTSPQKQRGSVMPVALAASTITSQIHSAAPLSRRSSLGAPGAPIPSATVSRAESFGGSDVRGSTSDTRVPQIAAVTGFPHASGAVGGSARHIQHSGRDSFGGSRACSPSDDARAVKATSPSRSPSPLRRAHSPCCDTVADAPRMRTASPFRGARTKTLVAGLCGARSMRASTPTQQRSPPSANASSRLNAKCGRAQVVNRSSSCSAPKIPTIHKVSAQLSSALLKEDFFATMPVRFQAGDSPPRSRILCYGDSLTVGYCNNGFSFEPYGRTMANVLGSLGVACEVSICGLSGLTAETMVLEKNSAAIRDIADCSHVGKGLAKILADEEQLPDLVLILVGTNDIGFVGHSIVTAEQILHHTQRLHEMCHLVGVPTVALIAPSSFIPAQRQVQRQLAALLTKWAHMEPQVVAQADCEDLAPRQAVAGRFWDPDEIHLSAAGQRAVGERLAHVVAPLLPARASLEQPSCSTPCDALCPEPPQSSPVRPPRGPLPQAAASFAPLAQHRASRGKLAGRPTSPVKSVIRMTPGGVTAPPPVARANMPVITRSLSRSQSAGSNFATLAMVQ